MTWDWIPRDEARQIEGVWAMEDAREQRRKSQPGKSVKHASATTVGVKGSFTSTTTNLTYSASSTYTASNATVSDWVLTREGEGKVVHVDKPRAAKGDRDVTIPSGTKSGSAGKDLKAHGSSDLHFRAVKGFWLYVDAPETTGKYDVQVRQGDRVIWNAEMRLLTVRRGDYRLDDPRFTPGKHVQGTAEGVEKLLRQGKIEAAPSVPEGKP